MPFRPGSNYGSRRSSGQCNIPISVNPQREPIGRRIHAIFDAPDQAEARRLLEQAIELRRKEAPRLAQWAESALPDGFAVFDYAQTDRLRLRTIKRPGAQCELTTTGAPFEPADPERWPTLASCRRTGSAAWRGHSWHEPSPRCSAPILVVSSGLPPRGSLTAVNVADGRTASNAKCYATRSLLACRAIACSPPASAPRRAA